MLACSGEHESQPTPIELDDTNTSGFVGHFLPTGVVVTSAGEIGAKTNRTEIVGHGLSRHLFQHHYLLLCGAFLTQLGDGGITRFSSCQHVATIVSDEIGLAFVKYIQRIERGIELVDGRLQLDCLGSTLIEGSDSGESSLGSIDGS